MMTMKTSELIRIAHKCGDRTFKCEKECPFYNDNESCVQKLLNAIAEKLEKALEDMRDKCSTCVHSGVPAHCSPCAECSPYEKWKWRGEDNE